MVGDVVDVRLPINCSESERDGGMVIWKFKAA